MIKVYQYRVLRLNGDTKALRDQLWRKNRYWNALVELQKSHQAQREQILRDDNAALTAAQAAQEAAAEEMRQAKAQVKRWKQQTKSAAHVPEELVGRVHASLVEWRTARDQQRELKRTAFTAEVKLRLQVLDKWRGDEVRRLRTEHKKSPGRDGLYWGNYLDVEAAYDTARQRFPNRLKFHAFRGEGCVSVWFQKGLPVNAIGAGDSRLTMRRFTGSYSQRNPGPSRPDHPKPLMSCWFRLGTETDTKQPIQLELTVKLHRPLPPEGIIRKASLTQTRVGGRWWWHICVTVNEPDPPECQETAPAVGIDIGWRKMGDGLRAATMVGEDGHMEEVRLPTSLIARFREVEERQSERDKTFNRAKAELLADCAGIAAAPNWLSEGAATLAQWSSPNRLAALALTWRDNQFPAGDTAYKSLEAWRKKDWVAWCVQSNIREKAIAQRREVYRLFAHRTAQRYPAVVIEDFDLRPLRESEDELAARKWNAKTVALSVLRLALSNSYRSRGQGEWTAPAEYTTQTCAACGELSPFDAEKDLRHQCDKCGAEYDQDENAASNLLRALRSGAAQRKALAPTKEGGARRKRGKEDVVAVMVEEDS